MELLKRNTLIFLLAVAVVGVSTGGLAMAHGLNKNLKGTQALLYETAQSLEDTELFLAEAEEDLSGAEERLKGKIAELDNSLAELESTKQDLGNAQQELKDTVGDLSKTRAHLEETETRLSGTETKLLDTENLLKEAQDLNVGLDNIVNSLRDSIVQKNIQIGGLQDQTRSLEARIGSLVPKPKNFSTEQALRSWAYEHRKPQALYGYAQGPASALSLAYRIQQEALTGGYIVNIQITPSTDYYTDIVSMGATAGNKYYYWNVDDGIVEYLRDVTPQSIGGYQ